MSTFLLACVFGISVSNVGTVRMVPIPEKTYRAIWNDQAETDSGRMARAECEKRLGKPADLAWIEVR